MKKDGNYYKELAIKTLEENDWATNDPVIIEQMTFIMKALYEAFPSKEDKAKRKVRI